MQNPVIPGLYELFDKDKGGLLGIFELNSLNEGVSDSDSGNIEVKLTINLKFTYLDHLQIKSRDNQFHACYINNSVFGDPRASLSSHSPFSIGAIELAPKRINGQRVGGMVIYQVIRWLKTFPEDTQVNPIKFLPDGNPNIAKRFYANIGVPINGDPFTIGDLKLHPSWTNNIKVTDLDTLQNKLNDLSIELVKLETQSANLKNQIHLLSEIQFTANLFIALKTYHIEPNLTVTDIDQLYIYQPQNQSKEDVINLYLTKQQEVQISKDNVQRYIQIISEFNEYKQAKNRWRNLIDAMKFFFKIYQNQTIITVLIFLAVLASGHI